MDSNTQGFTSYWRNTLADAESGKGAFERKDEESFSQWMDVDRGRLDEEIVQSFFEDEDEQVKTVEVMLRPVEMSPVFCYEAMISPLFRWPNLVCHYTKTLDAHTAPRSIHTLTLVWTAKKIVYNIAS